MKQNLDILSLGQRRTYDAVTQYLKEHPDATNREALKATGNHGSTYHAARVALNGGKTLTTKYKKRQQVPVMHTIPVDEPRTPQGFVIAMYGDPAKIAETIQLLRGTNQ